MPVAVNPMVTLPDWPATIQEHVNCPRKLSWPVDRTSNLKAMGPDPPKVPVGTIVPARSKTVLPSAVRTGTSEVTVVVNVPAAGVTVVACATGAKSSKGAISKDNALIYFIRRRYVLN